VFGAFLFNMSLETASSPEKAALSSSDLDGVSVSDGLAAHDHQRNDESLVTIGMPQSNGQNVIAEIHPDTSRHAPVSNWETMVSAIEQLQEIQSGLRLRKTKTKSTSRAIFETSNKLVPALEQLETTTKSAMIA